MSQLTYSIKILSFAILGFLCLIQMQDDNMRWMITMNVLNAFAQLFRFLTILNRSMGTGFRRVYEQMDHFDQMNQILIKWITII